jgi:hypothetical protein
MKVQDPFRFNAYPSGRLRRPRARVDDAGSTELPPFDDA